MSYAPTQRPVTARSSSSSDMVNLQVPTSMQRHRKTVSTGGGRAWSEAEVNLTASSTTLDIANSLKRKRT